MKQAVMIIVKEDGKYLLGKRSALKLKAAGYWCPISGHIEEGESEEDAVVREAFEELGVVVEPKKKITETRTHDGSVVLHWWVSRIVSGWPALQNEENSQLGWFTAAELQTLKPSFEEDLKILLTI